MSELANYIGDRINLSSIDVHDYITTDNMLQNCEGIVQYEGVPNIDSVIRYQKGDILISNIRPYLQKIWYADRDGGCSPDVLVVRVDDTMRYDTKYIYYALRQPAFFNHMMNSVSGTKMPRGNKDYTMGYTIPVPSKDEQQRIIAEIEGYESVIAQARAIMDGCAARKQEILNKYLQ